MRMTSCPPVSRIPSGVRKNYFGQSVQDAAIDEYRRALLMPFTEARYGSKVSCPQLVTLAKHVGQRENKVAETTMRLAFGALALGLPKSIVCRPFVVGHAIMSAQYPADASLDINDLNALETQLQGEFDQIQVKLWRQDYSTKTLTEAHERLTKMRDLCDKMLAWIEKKLYGPKQ